MPPNRLSITCGSAFKYQLVSSTIKEIPPSESPILQQDHSAGENVQEQCLGRNKRPNCCSCVAWKREAHAERTRAALDCLDSQYHTNRRRQRQGVILPSATQCNRLQWWSHYRRPVHAVFCFSNQDKYLILFIFEKIMTFIGQLV